MHSRNQTSKEALTPVPFMNLYAENQTIEADFLAQAKILIQTSQLVQGELVARFEKAFGQFLGSPHVIGCRSGFDALEIALRALELPEGSEVICPAQTFIATVFAVLRAGHKPVLADVDSESGLLDFEDMVRKWTSKTRVILPVHLYGQAIALGNFKEFAQEKNLYLIEDAAQAHGAFCGKQRAGTVGDFGCFSFYPSKNLGAFGQSGAIVTSQENRAEHCRAFRELGGIQKNHHQKIGWNARMDPFQAVALELKLVHLEKQNEKRIQKARRYLSQLKELDNLVLPFPQANQDHVYHLFVILLNSKKNRDGLQSFLHQNKIQSAIHYPVPTHLQPATRKLGYRYGDFPNAERFSDCGLSLPLYPDLPNESIDRVCQTIAEYFKWHLKP